MPIALPFSIDLRSLSCDFDTVGVDRSHSTVQAGMSGAPQVLLLHLADTSPQRTVSPTATTARLARQYGSPAGSSHAGASNGRDW